MIVIQYASEGDLHKYLQRKFTEIKWNKDKLRILYQISDGYLFIFNVLVCIHYNYNSLLLIILILLDLKPFIKQILYIEIFIVEIYYLT